MPQEFHVGHRSLLDRLLLALGGAVRRAPAVRLVSRSPRPGRAMRRSPARNG